MHVAERHPQRAVAQNICYLQQAGSPTCQIGGASVPQIMKAEIFNFCRP